MIYRVINGLFNKRERCAGDGPLSCAARQSRTPSIQHSKKLINDPFFTMLAAPDTANDGARVLGSAGSRLPSHRPKIVPFDYQQDSLLPCMEWCGKASRGLRIQHLLE
jgi:hypothetical protein